MSRLRPTNHLFILIFFMAQVLRRLFCIQIILKHWLLVYIFIEIIYLNLSNESIIREINILIISGHKIKVKKIFDFLFAILRLNYILATESFYCLLIVLSVSVRFLRKWNFAPGILPHMYMEVKFNFRNISQNNFFDSRSF